jgi:tetratricopeptide (TPR) repeat protein
MNEWMDAEQRVERAERLYEQGRWVEAAAELRAAIDADPTNLSWHYNLALTLDAMDDLPAAEQAYRAALRLDDDDIDVLNSLGVCLIRQHNYAEATTHFERIERLDPSFEPSYCNRIITYTETDRHDEAEVMFYLARQVKKDCSLCYANIGVSFARQGNFDRALNCWHEALRIEPTHVDTHARMADALWTLGRLEEAAKQYEQELVVNPTNMECLLDWGMVLLDDERFDDAREKFCSLLEVDSDHPGAHFCMGELYARQKEVTLAESHLRRAIAGDQNIVGRRTRLAQLLIETGQVEEALVWLEADLKIADEDISILGQISELYMSIDRPTEAYDVLQRLLKLCPNDLRVYHNMSVACLMIDRIEEAIQCGRRALQLQPDWPPALHNLAIAFSMSEQPVRAKRYIERALAGAPNDPIIKQTADELKRNAFGRPPKTFRPHTDS